MPVDLEQDMLPSLPMRPLGGVSVCALRAGAFGKQNLLLPGVGGDSWCCFCFLVN